MDEEKFTLLVSLTLDTLPEEFRSLLKNVEILVQDEPTEEQKERLHLSPRTTLFGLYEGVPQNVPGEGNALLPDRITLFRLPILSVASTEEEIREQVKSTLEHEIGHFFGMSEERLREHRKTSTKS